MAGIGSRSTAFWMRLTEPLLLRSKGHVATAKALRAARIARFPEWYLAMSYLAAGIFGAAMLTTTYLLLPIEATLPALAIASVTGVFAFLMMRLGFLAYPRIVAASRARRIDAQLPSVVTLCYALARGGMNPVDIFRAVAKERHAYGEAAVEFGVVLRNVEWFGMDVVSALKETSTTTPSVELRSFLDGLVTILNSGAEPRDYFKNQAETRLKQAELNLEREQEQAAMLAEIYVSGLLVLPLLLMVVLSGLAPLAPGQDALMPFVVFAMIPLGTAVYLVLLETLLPPEDLSVPPAEKTRINDFGVADVRAELPRLPPPWRSSATGHSMHGAADLDRKRSRALEWRLFFDGIARRVGAWFSRGYRRMVAKPADALEVSGFFALAVAGAGGWFLWQSAPAPTALMWGATGLLILATSIALIPVSIFHEIRMRRADRVDRALPHTLNRLASFNERGISLLQSFRILGNSTTGPLATELRAVDQDVTWNANFLGALRRLRARVSSVRMTKLTILLERAAAATGNLREVLDIAADDATRTDHLRNTRRQSMMSYVVVIYIVFAVFLYVLYVVADLFYGPSGLGAAAATGAASAGLGAATAKMLFAQAAVIQGVGCGLVAGRLGEGHLASGIKHAAFLGIAAYLIFHFGVL